MARNNKPKIKWACRKKDKEGNIFLSFIQQIIILIQFMDISLEMI